MPSWLQRENLHRIHWDGGGWPGRPLMIIRQYQSPNLEPMASGISRRGWQGEWPNIRALSPNASDFDEEVAQAAPGVEIWAAGYTVNGTSHPGARD